MISKVEQIKNILVGKQYNLALAESLTGGLCQATIVQCPGISQTFLGGVVAYNDEIKQRILKVSCDTLVFKTSVSKEVAEQMAKGVQLLFNADVTLSFTGEAGPISQVGEVGQVFITVMIKKNVHTLTLKLDGDRESIRHQAVEEGLKYLLAHLQKVDESTCN